MPSAHTAVSSAPRARAGSRDISGTSGAASPSSGSPDRAAERVSLLAWSCAGGGAGHVLRCVCIDVVTPVRHWFAVQNIMRTMLGFTLNSQNCCMMALQQAAGYLIRGALQLMDDLLRVEVAVPDERTRLG